ncbi:MAG: hypothetical protein WAZ19_09005 [Anaerolineae bacterium]
MLSFTPPYHVVNGYTVLPDHADETLFYVLPAAPQLALRTDGSPDLALLQYLGGGAGAARLAGGLLTLSSALMIPDDVLEQLRRPVMQRLNLPAPPRLIPALFESGSVELIALGSASELNVDADDAKTEEFGPFKVRFLGTGKPSLTGENRAVFQLLLDPAAAELLEKSFDAPDQPIVIVYRMVVVGLRPSFEITVEADWRKVYKHIENKAKVNVYYVSADAEAMITDALEDSNIRIDTAVFGAGPGAQAAAERARKQLLDWLLQRLFMPLVDPEAAKANSIGQVIDDTIFSLARTVLPGVGYKLRVLDEEQQRLLSLRMNEAVAERMEIVPQATLGGTLHRFQVDDEGKPNPAWPALRDGMISKINLDGFPRLEVQVAVEDRFTADGLASVEVELARRDPLGAASDAKSLLFRSAAEREDYVVNLLGHAPDFANLYQYRATVKFSPSGPFGPHDPVTSNWQRGAAAELFVEPRDVYTVRTIQIETAPIFSFSLYPKVSVELRGEGQTGRVRLEEAQQAATWRFRSFSSTPPPYEYRVTYHREAAQGGDLVSPWRQAVDDWLPVPDPLPVKHPLTLLVTLPWDEISVAFVRLRYDDAANNIHHDEQIDLSPDVRSVRRDFPIAAGGPQSVQYQLTIFMTDGALLEGAWRSTAETRLLLDRRLVDRRVLRIKALGGSLADHRLREVRITLQQREPDGVQVRQEHAIALAAADDGQTAEPWEYLPGDPPVKTVHYMATFVETDGFVRRTPWANTTADLLVLDLAHRRITA